MAYNYGKDAVTYSLIVFKQIQKIQEINAKELRDGSKIVKNLIGEQIIEAEDTRYSYLQSVETLGSLLSPYFGSNTGDEGITKEFEDFCKFLDMELITALKDEDYIVELKTHFTFNNPDEVKSDMDLQNQINVYFLNDKIKTARKIFRSLVKLFKEHDFLTGESYGESSSAGEDNMDAVDEEINEEYKE